MIAHVIGWTLVHSLWEGALIAALLLAIRSAAPRARSDVRYSLSVVALALMLAAPALTAVRLYRAGASGFSESIAMAAPASVAIATRERIDLLTPWLVNLWMLGVLAFSIRLVAGFARTRALVADGTRPADPWIVDLVERLMQRLDMRQVIRVFVSSRVQVPLVAGWLRPALLVPASLLTGLTPFQLELILVHELAHIRRHDYLVNVCQALAETLLFYHPAVWWISGRIREEREHCCDDFTLVACGGSAREYATVLLAIEESRGGSLGFAAAASGGSLVRRVRRLLGGAAASTGSRVRTLSASGGVALAAVLLIGLSTAATPRPLNRTVALETKPPRATPVLLLAPNPVVTRPRLDAEGVAAAHAAAKPARVAATRTDAALPLAERVRRAVARGRAEGDSTLWIAYTVRNARSGNVRSVYLDIAPGFDDQPQVLEAREGALDNDADGQAIMTLGSAENGESIGLLEQLVPSAPDSAGERVVELIGQHAGTPALDALAQIVRVDPEPMVKAAAVEAIGLLPLGSAVDTLSAMANDLATRQLRSVAVDALSQAPAAASAVHALGLIALSRSARPEERRNAVSVLPHFGPGLAVPALAGILENSVDRRVQHTALESLGSLAPSPDALTVLESPKGVWGPDSRPDLQVSAMKQLQSSGFAVDSTFLVTVVNQHKNPDVVDIALAMLGGQ